MATSDPYAPLYALFVQAHPDAVSGTSLYQFPNSKVPELVMDQPTMARFLLWADTNGYLPRPNKVAELLGAMSRALAEEIPDGD